MIKRKPSPGIAAGLILLYWALTLPLKALASCEEDCEVPRSCKEYLECRVSYMECLAACKQKEAWELYAQSSEKSIVANERMVQILEKTFQMSEKITILLDKLITKLMQEKVPQKPQETPESLTPATPAPTP